MADDNQPWTDEELIGYADIHCETDLALFHKDHARRLLDLAGLDSSQVDMRRFWSIGRDDMTLIFDKIKERKQLTIQATVSLVRPEMETVK